MRLQPFPNLFALVLAAMDNTQCLPAATPASTASSKEEMTDVFLRCSPSMLRRNVDASLEHKQATIYQHESKSRSNDTILNQDDQRTRMVPVILIASETKESDKPHRFKDTLKEMKEEIHEKIKKHPGIVAAADFGGVIVLLSLLFKIGKCIPKIKAHFAEKKKDQAVQSDLSD